jgi:hypothetical protein
MEFQFLKVFGVFCNFLIVVFDIFLEQNLLKLPLIILNVFLQIEFFVINI